MSRSEMARYRPGIQDHRCSWIPDLRCIASATPRVRDDCTH